MPKNENFSHISVRNRMVSPLGWPNQLAVSRMGQPSGLETRRADAGGIEAERGQQRTGALAQQHGGVVAAGAGRRLDAVAALPGRPEEAGRLRIVAADQLAVGDE